MSREVVFVDGMRTAFGTLGKTLRNILGEDLAGMTLKGRVLMTLAGGQVAYRLRTFSLGMA